MRDLIGGAITGRRAPASSLSSSSRQSLQTRDNRFAQNCGSFRFGLETLSLHRVASRGWDVVCGILKNKSRLFVWARLPSAALVSVWTFLFMSCCLSCARKTWASWTKSAFRLDSTICHNLIKTRTREQRADWGSRLFLQYVCLHFTQTNEITK